MQAVDLTSQEIDANSTLEADLCVIGSGAAGLALAAEFLNSAQSVIVLEAGGEGYDPLIQNDYFGESAGLIGDNPAYLIGSRLRYLGGTTNHWSGWCRPLDPIDFEARDWVPHSGWPFSSAELDPYYARAATVLAIKDFPRAKNLINHKTSISQREAPDQLESSLFQISPRTYRDEKLTMRAWCANMKQSSNIKIIKYSALVEIEANAQASQVERIRVRSSNSDRQFWVRARKYALACGGVENARMLLASNKVAKKGLGNDRDLVGRYFMDHPSVISYAKLLYLKGSPNLGAYGFYLCQAKGRYCATGLTLSEAYQRKHRLLGMYANLDMNHRQPDPANEFGKAVERTAYRISNRGALPRKEDYSDLFSVEFRIEQSPNPESRVTLSATKDRFDTPQAKLDWRMDPRDFETFKHGPTLLARQVGMRGLGRVRLMIPPAELKDHQAANYHHIGTTRMHRDAAHGVVNEHCQVHGISNLYMAGSSVFPTCGSAGPTFSIVALALRLADHLKGELKV